MSPDKKCMRLFFSWFIIVMGISLYTRIGFVVSLFIIGIGAYLRKKEDAYLFNLVAKSMFWKIFNLIYYLCMGLVIFIFDIRLSNVDMLLFIVIILLPLLILALSQDIKECISKKI